MEKEAAMLFEKIKQISSSDLTESEIQDTVAEIIKVLKSKHITYDRAYQILCVTQETLSEMSKGLEL